MKFIYFFCFLVLVSCENDGLDLIDDLDPIECLDPIDCLESDCHILSDYGVSAIRQDQSILLNFGINKIIDASVKVCNPDALEFYLSEDNIDFEKIVCLVPSESSYTITGLENGKEYYIKMVNLHCELESITSSTLAVAPGISTSPELVNSNISQGVEVIQLSSDGQSLIYRNLSDDWYLTSMSSPAFGKKVISDAFNARWYPDQSKLAYIKYTKQNNWIFSHKLMSYDVVTEIEEVLHEIENPGEYWMHEFHFSLDGQSIYFTSNKDNGGDSEKERRIYDNIWKLDLATNEIEVVTDFLSVDFDMIDYIEDPVQKNNFYAIGGNYNDYSNERVTDLFYYNASAETLTSIRDNAGSLISVSINPPGTKVIINSDRSGLQELWTLDVSNNMLSQISDRANYRPSDNWRFLNWIEDNKFMVYVENNDRWHFGIFEVD